MTQLVNEPVLKNSGLPQGICLKQSYGSFTSNYCLYVLLSLAFGEPHATAWVSNLLTMVSINVLLPCSY